MIQLKQIVTDKWHPSQRGWFAGALFEQMTKNKNIWLICVDLGYKIFDDHFEEFQDRTLNTGAAEQSAMDIAIGLALDGKIPFIYSITPFLLYRPFEALRTYINHEKIPVKLIASGRNNDYLHDGFSHNASDDQTFLKGLPNIKSFWPTNKKEIPQLVEYAVNDRSAYYINLSR